MAKRREQSAGRLKVIQNMLARLGMQASPTEAVAALAQFGIAVNEGLVRQVMVEMLKKASKAARQRVKLATAQRPQVRRPSKVPPRWGHRRSGFWAIATDLGIS
jgi:hypothetical protein